MRSRARAGRTALSPPNRPTRGKTAPNRLRRVDQLIAGWDPLLLRRRDGVFATAPFVDLGFGASPVTTIELARRLRRVSPDVPVIGVENDRARVEHARDAQAAGAARPGGDGPDAVQFEHGGFDLQPAGPARGIRAFNVLRQYDEADVAPAYRAMAAAVLPGGIIVEGTSDPSGRVWTAMIVRRHGAAPDPPRLEVEAIVFGTNFRAGLEAADFQAVLPKRLIHRMVAGEPAHAFMQDWATARLHAAGADTWGPRFAFARLAAALRERGHAVDPGDREPRRGRIVWRRPPVDVLAGA